MGNGRDVSVSVSESFDGISGRDGGFQIAARPSFYTEQFERVCPYYIAFGMTYEQFWDGDVEIAEMYRKAHELALDEQNSMAWLQGMYVYQAVGALAPALKAFAKGRAQPYMKHPFGYEEKRQAEMEKREKKRKQEETKSNAKTLMEIWAINFNEKWEKNEKLTMKSGESVDGRNNDTRN